MENSEVSIRVINYSGDFDDLNEVNLIGPYENYEEANKEINRIFELPGIDGLFAFEASDLVSNSMISPDEIAKVSNMEELSELI